MGVGFRTHLGQVDLQLHLGLSKLLAALVEGLIHPGALGPQVLGRVLEHVANQLPELGARPGLALRGRKVGSSEVHPLLAVTDTTTL